MLKVTGESLSPFFLQGDYILVVKLPFILHRLKPGDVIVFRHPAYGIMIKLLERFGDNGDELYVVGSHPESTDSRSFGAIPRRWVVGKVVWRIIRPTA